MYGNIHSACLHGIEGSLINVEIDLASGLPQTHIIGLPDSAVRESVERVRAALGNCGYRYPQQRITINLAPADLRKEGSAFDLAIAVGILITSGQLLLPEAGRTLMIGELALDGSLRPARGVLPMVEAARRSGIGSVLLPRCNAAEAALIGGMEIFAADHLNDLRPSDGEAVPLQPASGSSAAPPEEAGTPTGEPESLSALPFRVTVSEGSGGRQRPVYSGSLSHLRWFSPASGDGNASALSAAEIISGGVDYADVFGQRQAKRALAVAAAGMHNILLVGPPGTGKTMLIQRLPTIMPPLNDNEALEVTKIYSAAGHLPDARGSLIRRRPFRSPHHTLSPSGLAGGGSIPRPGEISLAHRGVLFLDELTEFSRTSLEVLRQPLEDGVITISRAKAVFTYPAAMLLAASMNPCPCGKLGFPGANPADGCSCTAAGIARYRSRLSGPLLDRIDLHVEVPRPQGSDRHLSGESSADIRSEVTKAWKAQNERQGLLPSPWNSRLQGAALRRFAAPPKEASAQLEQAIDSLGLSMRAYDRILKVARTIADLEGERDVSASHIAEAIQYRSLDRPAQPEPLV